MQTDKERFKVVIYYYQKALEVGIDNAGGLVQFRTSVEGDWRDGDDNSLANGEVAFHTDFIWRIKPETVMHNGGEYPKPCDDIGSETTFYYPDWKLSSDNSKVVASFRKVCINDLNAKASLSIVNAGLAHTTKEAAIAHAKVIYQIED